MHALLFYHQLASSDKMPFECGQLISNIMMSNRTGLSVSNLIEHLSPLISEQPINQPPKLFTLKLCNVSAQELEAANIWLGKCQAKKLSQLLFSYKSFW